MASSIPETEKKYNSIELDLEHAKRDKKILSNMYVFNYKADIVSGVLLIIGILLFIIGIALYKRIALLIVLLILGIVFILLAIFNRLNYNKKYQKAFYAYYVSAIDTNCKIKFENDIQISSLFPIRCKYNNDLKIVEFIYAEQHIKVVYDDILTYTVLEDDKDLEDNRIKNTNYNAKSYTLQITYNNKQRGNIKFYNDIKLFKLNNKYDTLIESNVKAINNIAEILDRIIHRNNI